MISYQILSRKKKKRSKYIYSKFNKTLIFIKQIWLIELWQNVLKKKIKDIWHRNQSLPICVYTFMLILNFHLIEINTGNICYNRVYFGKISSHLYISLCLLLALILQKTLLALHCKNCCTACHQAFCCQTTIHPSIKSRVPLVKPPKGPYLTMIQCIDPWAPCSPAGISLYLCIPTFN